eukprot:s291_g25.t1
MALAMINRLSTTQLVPMDSSRLMAPSLAEHPSAASPKRDDQGEESEINWAQIWPWLKRSETSLRNARSSCVLIMWGHLCDVFCWFTQSNE